MTKTKRDSYHHGDLRSALISAAEEIIAAEGVEGFTLRKAARKAGVSPGAPTHHFGSMAGLLSSRRASATRRFSPPERLVTDQSSGG